MDDKSSQEDEISALKSIYEENDIFYFDNEKNSGKFFIKYDSQPNEKFKIRISKLVE
jgi:hypothetical protein